MFYFLAVVTFLATILFYSFYPRSDAIKTVDKPLARTAIADLVIQHNAAVDAARVIISDSEKNKSTYTEWPSTIPYSLYEDHLPSGFIASSNINTRLICVNNNNGKINASICGHYSTTTTYPKGSTDFLISYTSIPNVEEQVGAYIANLAKKSLGEMVFLTRYTSTEHLHTNCGIVDCSASASGNELDPQGACMLNNTRYLTVRLPRQITTSWDGILVCITRLGASYDENNKIIYPPQ